MKTLQLKSEFKEYETEYHKSYIQGSDHLNIGDKCSNYLICGNLIGEDDENNENDEDDENNESDENDESDENEKYVCKQCCEFLGGDSDLIIINNFRNECKNCIKNIGISQNQLDLNLEQFNLESVITKLIGSYLFGNIRVQLPQCEHFYCKNCFIECFLQENEEDYDSENEEDYDSEDKEDEEDSWFDWTECVYCHKKFD